MNAGGGVPSPLGHVRPPGMDTATRCHNSVGISRMAGGLGTLPLEAWASKAKEFVHILLLDGELTNFPDWSERISAKLFKPQLGTEELLTWAE